MKTSWLPIWAVCLAIVVGLPLAGKWARSTPEKKCDLDGAKIDPVYRVRVVDGDGAEHAFCCIQCASHWLGHQRETPRWVVVTDEVSGKDVDAASAWYVRSLVVTVAHTGNRVHAFANHADAAKHMETGRGTVLEGPEKPFYRDLPRTIGNPGHQ
jgi:hypothetical protein